MNELLKIESVQVILGEFLKYQNFSNLVYQLQYEVREIVGARNIIITLREQINSNKDPKW